MTPLAAREKSRVFGFRGELLKSDIIYFFKLFFVAEIITHSMPINTLVQSKAIFGSGFLLYLLDLLLLL